MKKFFNRDKPKMAKVTPVTRGEQASNSIDGSPQELPPRPSVHTHTHSQSYIGQPAPPRGAPGPQPPQRTGSLGYDGATPEPLTRRSSEQDPWEVVSAYDRTPEPDPRDPRQVVGSYSSMAPMPPGVPTGAILPPRSSSPYSTSSQTYSRSEKHLLKKKPPQAQGGSPGSAVAALGILNSLSANAVPPPQPSPPGWDEEPLERPPPERKEKKSFWGRDRSPDKSERQGFWQSRDRSPERKGKGKEKDEDSIMRMIGYLVAHGSEDWALVLELCERVSESDSNAKEGAKALRREFKYGEPAAQMSAAKLWAIMLNNCSDAFMVQCAGRKFLDTIEDVLISSRITPVVRERIVDVLAGATWAATHGPTPVTSPDPVPPQFARGGDWRVQASAGRISKDKNGFKELWRKVRPPDKPEAGVPFDMADAMFSPPTPKRNSEYEDRATPVPFEPMRSPSTPMEPSHRRRSSHKSRNRVIPPDEDMRRLFQECKVGRGNASLLGEALAFAKPQDLSRKIIREFYIKCQASQEFITMQIPWATAGAERSRMAREAVMRPDDPPGELTIEERLLAELLGANEELLEALRVYDDLERLGIEREAEERSKREVRMDRSRMQYSDADGAMYLEPPAGRNGGGSSSRSSSPSSPSSSPRASLYARSVNQRELSQTQLPPANAYGVPQQLAHNGHPLPPVPNQMQQSLPYVPPPPPLFTQGHGVPPPPGQPYQGAYPAQATQGSPQAPPAHPPALIAGGLAPPPGERTHRFGPRSPAVSSTRSRTPSPERGIGVPMQYTNGASHYAPRNDVGAQGGAVVSVADGLGRLHISDRRPGGYDSDEDVLTPIKPSAKALGKRRAVEAAEDREDRFDPDDMFRDDGADIRSDDLRSDEGEEGREAKPVRYAYDAVQERRDELLRLAQAEATARGDTKVNGVR